MSAHLLKYFAKGGFPAVQGKQIFYYHTSQGLEVDFITIDKDGARELIQVTWDMSDEVTANRKVAVSDT